MTAAQSLPDPDASTFMEVWREEERIIARVRRAISALRHEIEIDAGMVARKAMLKRGPHDDETLQLYREVAARELQRRFGWSGKSARWHNRQAAALRAATARLRVGAA